MLAASAGLPFRPYVYRGHDRDEPDAVAEARERHRENNARLTLRAARLDAAAEDPDGPDPGVHTWEWYRELREDTA